MMGVNLGNGYLTRNAGAEIVHYLIRSSMLKKVTEPIKGSEIRYYSVLNNGSSSAKTITKMSYFLSSLPQLQFQTLLFYLWKSS